jgi:ABC-type nitrate/sulfonate/bicarbonate transport system ATPase subunit
LKRTRATGATLSWLHERDTVIFITHSIEEAVLLFLQSAARNSGCLARRPETPDYSSAVRVVRESGSRGGRWRLPRREGRCGGSVWGL